MSTFTARYPSRCGVCDGRIREGDDATYVDDEIAHAHCPQPEPATALVAACPRCWMVPAKSGACGCEDS